MYKHFNKKIRIHHYHRPKKTRCGAIKSWCSKWDQIISALVAFTVFIALLLLVIYNIGYERVQENYDKINETYQRVIEGSVVETQAHCFVPSTVNNTITCQYFNETNQSTLSGWLNNSTNRGNYSELVLMYVQFNNGKIDKSWLENVKLPLNVLAIISCDLNDIGAEAFTGTPFNNLKILKLYDTKITYLKRQSFLNTQIEEFAFIHSHGGKNRVNIEAKFLEGMANTLRLLDFKYSLTLDESLTNLTGVSGVNLPNLVALNLSFNSLKRITGASFTNCSNLETLDLSSNRIKFIDYDSFQLPKLKHLDISRNLLTTLPEGVFDTFRSGSIQIEHNNWKCDCDLLWFEYFFTRFYDELFENVEFLCNDLIPHYQMMFCDNDTLASNGTTIQETTTITTTTTPNLVWIDCKLSKTTAGYDLLYFSHKIPIRNNTIEFSFYQINDKPKYMVEIDGNYQMDYLLWKNSNNRSDVGCFMIASKSFEINLEYEQTYTLCLLKYGTDIVSPFDCTSLTVPPKWSSRTWLENNKKPLVIGVLCSAILITIISTCLITFYCIRQHPKLIKGNKRVIIVGNKTADAIILPKTYERNYAPPSFNSYSDGYLTPKTNYYTTNDNNYVNTYDGPALSTISEKSLESIYADIEGGNSVNYGRGKTLEKHQMMHGARLEHVCSTINDRLYESPPPLPPNHPSQNF